MIHLLILLIAAALGGAVNALAGGGTFLVFPALLFTGVASVVANATSSLVAVPGSIASTWVYRDAVNRVEKKFLIWMLLASFGGSAMGSVLLLRTSNATFSRLVPWLLFAAASVFTIAPKLRKAAEKRGGGHSPRLMIAGQFIISIYGGYFGAGMGVLMMALYLAASEMDVHTAAGLRTISACVINILAVAIFAMKGAIDYRDGIPMVFAGIAGGYYGAKAVRGLTPDGVRKGILIYAWALTAWFFAKAWV